VDESLCDLAADVVASTPSNAAQMLTRDRKEVIANCQADVKRINNLLNTKIDEISAQNRGEVERVAQQIVVKITTMEQEVQAQIKILAQLNPENVLARGYALVTGNIGVGNVVKITTSKAEIDAKIERISERS
jgi:exodeoxyribonuclease VII large subunit